MSAKVVTICDPTCLRTSASAGEFIALIKLGEFGRGGEKSAKKALGSAVGGVSLKMGVDCTSGCLNVSRPAAEGISEAFGGVKGLAGEESAKNRFSVLRGGPSHSINAGSKFRRRMPLGLSAEGIFEPESLEANSPGAESAEM